LQVSVTVHSGSSEGRTHYEIGHFIDGATVAGNADRWGAVAQPATGETQARVAFASTDEVDQAVDAGERAFDQWSNLTVVQRAAILPLWTVPIAIACGNTFVLKPSEKDPSCSLRLAELFHQAGMVGINVPSRYRCPSTVLEAGSDHSLVATTSTALRGSASSPESRP